MLARPSMARRINPHPGALTDPDFFAMEQIEGRMTRRQLKAMTFYRMYSGIWMLPTYGDDHDFIVE